MHCCNVRKGIWLFLPVSFIVTGINSVFLLVSGTTRGDDTLGGVAFVRLFCASALIRNNKQAIKKRKDLLKLKILALLYMLTGISNNTHNYLFCKLHGID